MKVIATRLVTCLIIVAIFFPSTVVIAAPLQESFAYTVVRGDTLYSLSRRYNTTVNAIMELNDLYGTTIYIDQVLLIPATNSPSESSIYVIVSGDTLYSIAHRYGITVASLMEMNHLYRTLIFVGQYLTVPQSAIPVATLTPISTVVSTSTPLIPTATPTPTATPACEPHYPDFCVPVGLPKLNCSDEPVKEHRAFRVLPPDPYGLDGNDKDGIGCENN